MAGTKQLQDARIVLLRLDGAEAEQAAKALQEFGLSNVVALSNPSELSVHIQDGRVDVIVLADTDLPEEWHSPAGLARPPAAAVDAGIPCLLLLSGVTRAAANAAHAAGFSAVMAADSAPRVIYRRLGALLQRARRVGRTRDAAGEPA
ncbi:hypothetical protein [Phreatobacter sp.]|uniref:hypothetical protein n=1 Tax=Phreatobacter sp. TaxID=1966341 RepID=UPI003F729AEB